MEMDNLNHLRQQGMLSADWHCRKLYMGAIAWSPTVQKAQDLVEVWGDP